jgi:DNA-binding MarR family transcriptional regulator
MQKFMKMLNNISRSQGAFRKSRISDKNLNSGHYAYALAICHNPGRSQEDLARELCINKSTIARNLSVLEEKGYITRAPLPNDKRQFSVHPTEKMRAVLPEIKRASEEWMLLLSEGIPEEELAVFNSVLQRMQEKAREITGKQEESK